MRRQHSLMFEAILLAGLILSLNACGNDSGGGGSTAPAAPTGLIANASDQQIILSWNASPGATYYNVYWSMSSTVSTTSGSRIYGITTTSSIHNGLTNGITYYYIVTAVNANGESPASSMVSAAPAAPTLTVTPFGAPIILNPVAVPSITAPTTITQNYRVTVTDAAGLPLNGIDVNFLGQFSSGVNINFGGIIDSAPPNGSGTISVVKQTDNFGYLLFAVTAPYYNPAGLPIQAPFNQSALGSPSGGALAEDTYYYTITARDFIGETTASGSFPVIVTSGTSTATTTGSVSLSWQAVPGATSYNIYRGTVAGLANTRLVATLLNPSGDPVTFLDSGYTATTAAPPTTNTTGISLNSIIGTAQASTGAAFTSFDINF